MEIAKVLGGGFFLLIGSAMLKKAVVDYRDFERSLAWPSVQGKITRSELIRGLRGGDGARTSFTFSVGYTYEYQGKEYEGNRATLWQMIDFETSKQFVERFPEGSDVEVFLDPSFPGKAVLIVGAAPDGKVFGGIILSALGILVGAALVWWGFQD